MSSLDELENFAMGQARGNTDTQSDFLSVGKRPGAEKKARGPGVSSIDELEDFFMGRVRRNADIQSDFLSGGNSSGPEKKAGGYCKRGPYENKHKAADDLESFFSAGLRSSSVPKSRPMSSVRARSSLLSSLRLNCHFSLQYFSCADKKQRSSQNTTKADF